VGILRLERGKDAIKHPDGKKKDAEYGAVLWVQFTAGRPRRPNNNENYG
jgi:hypothetical protein